MKGEVNSNSSEISMRVWSRSCLHEIFNATVSIHGTTRRRITNSVFTCADAFFHCTSTFHCSRKRLHGK